MRKSVLTLVTLLWLSILGLAQNGAVNIKGENRSMMALNLPIDMNLELPIGLDQELDINFRYDFHINDISILGSEKRDFSQSEYDPRKEDIKFIIGDDEYESDTEIVVKNINGEVKIIGYDGDEILVNGTKELWKKRGDVSDEEALKYSLKTKSYQGKLYIYVDSPNAHVEFENGRMNYHWHWDEDNRRRVSFNFDLEIKVPKKLALRTSTVNDGDLYIENMMNGVLANNVNGGITVKDVKGYTTANTVNGDIEVWFLESPTEDTDFQTVNGTIEIFSPKDLSAVVTFESLHGELYTDFEQVKHLPNRLNKEKDGNGYRYRINKTSPVQIGDGAIEIGFKMVNGDAYIRTRKL